MEAHRKLEVTGSVAALEQLRTLVSDRITNGWQRDRERESRINSETEDDHLWFFQCAASGDRPAAVLWWALLRGEQCLRVVNITSRERNLTKAECNEIVEDFHTRFVRPAAEELGLHVDFGAPEVGPEDWMTRDTAARLRRFAVVANKETGLSHPRDQEFWCDFLIAAHKENAELNAWDLAQWLMSRGWSPDAAHDLAGEYALGRELLRAYDQPGEQPPI